MFDLVIRGARVLDGTGGAPRGLEIAVQGDRLAQVAPRIDEPARATLDAGGLVLAPGFIDIHSHSDLYLFRFPLSPSKLAQGVTTEATGNCGIGLFPVTPERRGELEAYLRMHDFRAEGRGITWRDFADYAAVLDRLALGPNLAPLAAHGTLRLAVMGSEDRPATPEELERMGSLLDRCLGQGAWGLSTGLIYPPGSFAGQAELASLAKVVRAHGALFTSHVRGEGATLAAALEEIAAIGRESGARLQVSHLKALGKANWGQGAKALEFIARARAQGVDLAADQYPYEASSTALSALVPGWAHSGGVAALLARLEDQALLPRLGRELGEILEGRGGAGRVVVTSLGSAANAGLSGLSLAEIAGRWGIAPVEAALRLLREEKAQVSAVYFSISPDDVAAIMQSPLVCVGSDGEGLDAVAAAGFFTHPRSYGTFPRVLGRYVREKNLLPLPLAVYKMTGLPASRLGLADRGSVAPGCAADLVLFDPATVGDRADFVNPHQYAAGIVHVLVNGRFALRDGRLTGEAAGRVLRKPAAR